MQKKIVLSLSEAIAELVNADLALKPHLTLTTLVHEIIFAYYEPVIQKRLRQAEAAARNEKAHREAVARRERAKLETDAQKQHRARFGLPAHYDYNETTRELTLPTGQVVVCLPDRIDWFTKPQTLRLNCGDALRIPGIRYDAKTRLVKRADGMELTCYVENADELNEYCAKGILADPTRWTEGD
jgi:hypothetical protein